MITLVLIVKLTVVLTSAFLGLFVCRALNAPMRHCLCTAAVVLALLLPFFAVIGAAVPLTLPAVFTVGVRSATLSSHAFLIPWHTMWLTGLLLVVARYLTGLFYLAWRTQQASPFAIRDSFLSTKLAAAHASVRLAPIPAPLVWGWVRPVILIPEAAATWSPQNLRLALLHELAHVDRFDLWTSLLWICAKALYWFHPLVWWLSARARQEQELACDSRVLAAGASPAEYAGLLVDIARHVHSPAVFGCAMVTHPKLLKGRVMRILHSQPPPASRKGLISLFVSACLLAAASVVAIAAPDHPGASADQHVNKIGGDVSAPRVISKVEPGYSKAAKDKKITGAVLLRVVIDRSGHPKDIHVLRSLDPDLDANAVAAVTQWRFSPATKAGKPVTCEAKIEVNFRLL
jgi:TonB family protein